MQLLGGYSDEQRRSSRVKMENEKRVMGQATAKMTFKDRLTRLKRTKIGVMELQRDKYIWYMGYYYL